MPFYIFREGCMPDFINKGVINYMKKYCTWLLVLQITDDLSAVPKLVKVKLLIMVMRNSKLQKPAL